MMLRLTKEDEKRIEMGMEAAFTLLEDIADHPEKYKDIPTQTQFFPISIKKKDKEFLFLGIKPEPIPII